MNTDVIETTAELVPIIPVDQLAEINATDQYLGQLRSRATELAALGVPQTKEQYEEVHRVTMVSVKVRTESDKLARRLAAPYKDKYDQIRAEGKRIGDHAAQSEALTRPLKEQYEAEQDRLRIEAEKAAAARIQARIDSIVKLGFVFDGTGYSAAYADDFRIDSVEVQALPDNDWDLLFDSARVRYEEHKTWLTFQRQQAEAEAKRIEDQRLVEVERLRVQAEQQRVEQQRLADERATFEQEQAAFRVEQQRFADEQATEAKKLADERELQRLKELWKDRANVIVHHEFVLTRNGVFINGYEEEWEFSFEGLTALSDEEFKTVLSLSDQKRDARIAAEKKATDDAKAAADDAKAKQQADNERANRLASDRTRLTQWLDGLVMFDEPDVRQPEAIEMGQRFVGRLVLLKDELLEELKAL